MIIGDGDKPYVFVHNPRTAGTTLLTFLIEYCRGVVYCPKNELYSHYVKHRVYADGPERIKNYFKFGFVRNPFSREYSLYKLLTLIVNNMTFKEWVMLRFANNIGSEYEKIKTSYTLPQYGYFCNLNGELVVNWFKYEDRLNALEQIGNVIGVNMKTMRDYRPLNNSMRFDVVNYYKEYDNEMIDLVEKAYKIDLDAFGYTFDGNKETQPVSFKFDGDIKYYATNYLSEDRYNKYKA